MVISNILDNLKKIAQSHDSRVYLVGGPLRDKLLGRGVKDLDIVVDKLIHIIGKDLAANLNAKFQFYQNFNTGTIILPQAKTNGNSITHIDIAQTRKEIYSKPAELPKVAPADLIADLYRRDFTINAMAEDLVSGELIDPFRGREDLKNKVIRALHPKSFIDDPTRIFRAIRFAERFNFKIEPETLQWLRNAVNQKLVSLLSGERVLNELRLMAKEQNWEKMIRRLNQEKVFRALFSKNLTGNFFNQLREVAKVKDANLRLIHLLAQFKLPANFPITKEMATAIKDWQEFPKVRKQLEKATYPSEVYRILRQFSNDALKIAQLVENPKIAIKIKNYLERYQMVKTELGGNDVKALGITPGAIYSELLDQILLARLDGKVKTRADELELLKKLVRRNVR